MSSARRRTRSEEHTSELQSPVVISYAVFCLKKKHDIAAQHSDSTVVTMQNSVRSDIEASVLLGRSRILGCVLYISFFFFNATATTEIYTTTDTLSLHDALPISRRSTFCRIRWTSSSGRAALK